MLVRILKGTVFFVNSFSAYSSRRSWSHTAVHDVKITCIFYIFESYCGDGSSLFPLIFTSVPTRCLYFGNPETINMLLYLLSSLSNQLSVPDGEVVNLVLAPLLCLQLHSATTFLTIV